jgi:acetyl esterase/lipase
MVMNSPSYQRLGEGYFLTLPKMRWFRDHYLRQESDAKDPRCSPLRGRDFSRLPPTLVVTASLDPLVDEGAAYADRLRAAGVPTEYVCLDGWLHGFLYWPGCEALHTTMDRATASLKRAFGERRN